MKYKAVLFDLDNTLANTENFVISNTEDYKDSVEFYLYNFLRPELRTVSWEKFLTVYNQAKSDIKKYLKGQAASHVRYLYIKRTLELLNANFRPRLISDAQKVYWSYINNHMQLYPGVETILQRVKENYLDIGIITDFTAEIQIDKLEMLGIEKYIDFLITSEEAGADKPSVKPLYMALKKLELSKDEVIIVGNNPKTDIKLANSAYVDSVLFDYDKKFTDQVDEINPTHYITNFYNLNEILDLKVRHFTNEKLVVFDFLGSLFTSDKSPSEILSEELDLEYDLVDAYYKAMQANEITIKTFWNRIKKDTTEYTEGILSHFKLNPNSVDLLKDLKSKHKLAIFSSFPKEWGLKLLEEADILNYFDDIYLDTNDSSVFEKYEDKIKHSNMYFLNDNLEQLKRIKQYDVKTIFYQLAESDESTWFVPDYAVKELAELQQII